MLSQWVTKENLNVKYMFTLNLSMVEISLINIYKAVPPDWIIIEVPS